MSNKESNKLAYEAFKNDFIADESISVETSENLYYGYAIPTQKQAKYSLIRLILEPIHSLNLI